VKELRLEYPENGEPVSIEMRVKAGDEVQPGAIIALASMDMATQEVEAYEGMRICVIRQTARGFVLVVEELDKSC